MEEITSCLAVLLGYNIYTCKHEMSPLANEAIFIMLFVSLFCFYFPEAATRSTL